MSKLVNEMLRTGDDRLVSLIVDGNVVEHTKSDFHSFYSSYCGLLEISEHMYEKIVRKGNQLLYGLKKSPDFIDNVPVDTSTYLLTNGFQFDGKKWKKETERGSVTEDGFPGCHQRLFWNIVRTDEDGDEWNDKIHVTVTNSQIEFLPVLDRLLSLDPVKDCGLDPMWSYKIRYQRGSVGLSALDRFVDSDEVIRHASLFEAIERIR